MRKVTALATLACCAALAAAAQKADPPKTDPKAAAKPAASKPDTRSDFLRTESVKADEKPAEKKPVSNVRLNLNKDSVAEFAKLPGMTDAKARAIVKGRPYRSKEELVNKKILTAAEYEEVKGNLYAGR